MKNLYVYAYNAGSNGAEELAQALGVPRIRHHGSKFKGASYKRVINWGATEVPGEVRKCKIANPPGVISGVNNKLRFFQRMTDASLHVPLPRTVPWTSQRSVAEEWLKKSTVVVRKSLTGHSGAGIVIVEPGELLPDASLYTQYIPKSAEYRIHIMNGGIIFRQRKIKNPELDQPVTWKIRSHDNGFIFQHTNLSVPKDVEDQAMKVFKATGLDFAGLDVIWSDKQQKAYILEANSACGLEGATIQAYADGFKEFLNRA